MKYLDKYDPEECATYTFYGFRDKRDDGNSMYRFNFAANDSKDNLSDSIGQLPKVVHQIVQDLEVAMGQVLHITKSAFDPETRTIYTTEVMLDEKDGVKFLLCNPESTMEGADIPKLRNQIIEDLLDSGEFMDLDTVNDNYIHYEHLSDYLSDYDPEDYFSEEKIRYAADYLGVGYDAGWNDGIAEFARNIKNVAQEQEEYLER